MTLQKYLKVVWEIEARIYRASKRREAYRLELSPTNMKTFCRLILPYMPPTPKMLYKVALTYKKTDLQQRWISELIEKSVYTEEVVRSFYKNLDSENDIVH